MNIAVSPAARRLVTATAVLGAFAVPAVASAAHTSAAPKPVSCKSVTKNISYLNIARLGTKQAHGAFTCQSANVVGNTWMLRFNAHEQVQSFKVNFISYRCKLVPTLPRNTACIGGGTRVKFAAPTGG